MSVRTVLLLVVAIWGAIIPGVAVAQERRLPQSAEEVQLSYAPVVREVAPAVVNVYATTIRQQTTSPFANDPFFQRFFGGESPLFRSRPRESQSLGSGVVIAEEGVVLTNSHVVSGATDIRIAFTNGREYAVDLILDDPQTDLAVLRIQRPDRPFPALAFGDSDALEVGDLVLALGNPFGVGQTVTSGIVSALARTGVQTSDYGFFIQTDAAINPGNSGGALVNMRGELVGINSTIFTRSGGSLGIGFAIPANMARVVANAAMKGGDIVRPWLGVALQEVSFDIANSLGIDPPRGALVTQIADDSSAERAGLRSGDVILAVDAVAINDTGGFNYRLATKEVGGTAELTIIRDGREIVVDVELVALPESQSSQQIEISGNTRFAGVTAEALLPALADELGLPFDSEGIAIIDVASNSPAASFGLRRGDIIRSLNGEDITTLRRFGELASTRPRGGWRIVLQRGNQVIRSFVSG